MLEKLCEIIPTYFSQKYQKNDVIIYKYFKAKYNKKARSYRLEEIKDNECKALNFFKRSLVSVSALSDSGSISAFPSLVAVPSSIAISTVGVNCAITTRIKIYQSIIEKKKKNNNKIVLLAIAKLITIEVLISKALIDSYINHDEMNNVLREDILRWKKKLKILKMLWNILYKNNGISCE